MITRARLPGLDSRQVSGRQHNELFTMDGAILPLLSATPLSAGFASAITPLQTGAPDVAFPRLNLLSYCLFVPGGLIGRPVSGPSAVPRPAGTPTRR
jgi:heme/copper-type cytochrome/quinol oxidase subunit 1